MKKIVLATAVVLSVGVTSASFARDPVADAVAARKAAFTLMAANFGPMGAMTEGKMPFNKEVFAQRAANVDMLAKMPWEFFIPDSSTGDSKAKPEVWSKASDYKAAADKFQLETAKLAQVSKSGDEAAMKAQFGATAKTCKGCHQDFKNK